MFVLLCLCIETSSMSVNFLINPISSHYLSTRVVKKKFMGCIHLLLLFIHRSKKNGCPAQVHASLCKHRPRKIVVKLLHSKHNHEIGECHDENNNIWVQFITQNILWTKQWKYVLCWLPWFCILVGLRFCLRYISVRGPLLQNYLNLPFIRLRSISNIMVICGRV